MTYATDTDAIRADDKPLLQIIFCIIWPLLTLGLVVVCLVQRAQIKKLRHSVPLEHGDVGERTIDRLPEGREHDHR